MNSIRVKLIRGGTSKGIYINQKDFNYQTTQRENILLKLLGSPDSYKLQLNGLGTGISSTSKIVLYDDFAIRNGEECLDYLFGQVSVTEPKVDFSGTCGNLASGLPVLPDLNPNVFTTISTPTIINGIAFRKFLKVWSLNKHHAMKIYCDSPQLISISGIEGKSNPIYVSFELFSPNSKPLLPTNSPTSSIYLNTLNKMVTVTLLISGNPIIIINSKEISNKPLSQLSYDDIFNTIDELREKCAIIMGIELRESLRVCLNEEDFFKITAPPGRFHHAMTGTGSLNLLFASKIPGSVIERNKLIIKHPSGEMECFGEIIKEGNNFKAINAGFFRTSRLLLDGNAYF